ncbi:MAG: B12-binding domain-containing radical SAM protein [Acidobacteria bacterium]|nr:B12-binding domain-containing radical SAM protein [Acidobacteriota bacterium]
MIKRRVLLFNPRGSFTHHPVHVPPIALEFIAAYVKDIAEIQIVDLCVAHKPPAYYLSRFKPDIVGITGLSPEIPHVFALARTAKEFNCQVVVGGYHATSHPKHTLQCPFVDFVVRKEGELTFRDIVAGKQVKEIQGISYREGTEIIHNEDRPWIKDIDEMPLPARELRLFPRRYSIVAYGAEIIDTIYSSRGCNFKCDFCITPFHQGPWRSRSAANIIEEFKQSMRLFNTNHFFFVDEDFFHNIDRVTEFCDRVISMKQNLTLCAEGRVDLFVKRPDLVPKLKEAGFNTINIGIESNDNSQLKKMKKGITREAIIAAVDILKKNNINVMGTIMIGFPDEEEEQIIDKINFANTINIDSVHYAYLNAYKGTPLYDHCLENDLFVSTDWFKDSHDYQMIKCQNISTTHLKKLRCHGMVSFYTLKRIIQLKKNYQANLARTEAVPFYIKVFQVLSELKLIYGNGKAYYLKSAAQFIPDFFKNLCCADKEEKAVVLWERPKKWPKIFWPSALRFYQGRILVGAYIFTDSRNPLQPGFYSREDLSGQRIKGLKIHIEKLNRWLSVLFHVLPRYVKGRCHLLGLLGKIFIRYYSFATHYYNKDEMGLLESEEKDD